MGKADSKWEQIGNLSTEEEKSKEMQERKKTTRTDTDSVDRLLVDMADDSALDILPAETSKAKNTKRIKIKTEYSRTVAYL